ncbi:MAG: GNAT family N-acetyltransferase [Sandaracinaceae bacterium]|nr:GNAT family N-acetyltransferase [Sandaracinaceae bacterium]
MRRARRADLEGIWACQRAAYASLPESGLCDRRHLELQLKAFPEGQVVVTLDKVVVGYAMSLIVQLDEDSPWYSYNEITGAGTFSTHTPSADTLYGADIAVHPDHRGKGVGKLLYRGRVGILERFNLRRMIAGGRIPGFYKVAGRMTAEEYVAAVEAKRIHDPALSLHLAIGYQVRAVHHGYLRDEHSLDYATFLEMLNPSFHAERRRIAGSPLKRPVRRVRVCAAQYQMRPISGWEDLEQQVSFFVKTAQAYHCHFLVFPELFTAQLFSSFPRAELELAGISRLTELTDRYQEMFTRFASESGLFIVGGSHPVREGDETRNVAHLFTPSGGVYTQEKLHVTPNERKEYGIAPGNELSVFDTGYARVAMLVCYDIEFPELSRILTLAGAEILLVPFSTDERKAYLRVRYSAHARAVENIVYVVLSGNVGNLPQVDNFLINYGHAAICTPSDFAFPTDGLAAVADTASETVVIADLDLDALQLSREIGSVRPLRDRRADLYELVSKIDVNVIRTK